jgi:hypothetical protein
MTTTARREGGGLPEAAHVAIQVASPTKAKVATAAAGAPPPYASRPAASASGVQVLAPVDRAVDSASAPEERVCLICLEEESAERADAGERAQRADDEMLYGICACKTTAIHQICLEKLVNSRGRRKLNLEERMACPVCAQGFTVPYTCTALPKRGLDPATAPRSPRRSLSFGILISFGVAFAIRLLTDQLGRQLAFLICTLFAFVFLFAVVYGHKRAQAVRARRARQAAGQAGRGGGGRGSADLDDLDDEQYFLQVVQQARGAPRGAQGQAVIAADATQRTQRLVIHIGPAGAVASHASSHTGGSIERTAAEAATPQPAARAASARGAENV